MEKINNIKHQVVRSHPMLTKIRQYGRRGPEVIVYKHLFTGNYILAETNGRVTREITVLKGWPQLSNQQFAEVVARLRPHPGTITAKNRQVCRFNDGLKERGRNAGRFIREHVGRMRSKQKGVKKDHPSLVYKKIHGED